MRKPTPPPDNASSTQLVFEFDETPTDTPNPLWHHERVLRHVLRLLAEERMEVGRAVEVAESLLYGAYVQALWEASISGGFVGPDRARYAVIMVEEVEAAD